MLFNPLFIGLPNNQQAQDLGVDLKEKVRSLGAMFGDILQTTSADISPEQAKESINSQIESIISNPELLSSLQVVINENSTDSGNNSLTNLVANILTAKSSEKVTVAAQEIANTEGLIVKQIPAHIVADPKALIDFIKSNIKPGSEDNSLLLKIVTESGPQLLLLSAADKPDNSALNLLKNILPTDNLSTPELEIISAKLTEFGKLEILVPNDEGKNEQVSLIDVKSLLDELKAIILEKNEINDNSEIGKLTSGTSKEESIEKISGNLPLVETKLFDLITEKTAAPLNHGTADIIISGYPVEDEKITTEIKVPKDDKIVSDTSTDKTNPELVASNPVNPSIVSTMLNDKETNDLSVSTDSSDDNNVDVVSGITSERASKKSSANTITSNTRVTQSSTDASATLSAAKTANVNGSDYAKQMHNNGEEITEEIVDGKPKTTVVNSSQSGDKTTVAKNVTLSGAETEIKDVKSDVNSEKSLEIDSNPKKADNSNSTGHPPKENSPKIQSADSQMTITSQKSKNGNETIPKTTVDNAIENQHGDKPVDSKTSPGESKQTVSSNKELLQDVKTDVTKEPVAEASKKTSLNRTEYNVTNSDTEKSVSNTNKEVAAPNSAQKSNTPQVDAEVKSGTTKETINSNTTKVNTESTTPRIEKGVNSESIKVSAENIESQSSTTTKPESSGSESNIHVKDTKIENSKTGVIDNIQVDKSGASEKVSNIEVATKSDKTETELTSESKVTGNGVALRAESKESDSVPKTGEVKPKESIQSASTSSVKTDNETKQVPDQAVSSSNNVKIGKENPEIVDRVLKQPVANETKNNVAIKSNIPGTPSNLDTTSGSDEITQKKEIIDVNGVIRKVEYKKSDEVPNKIEIKNTAGMPEKVEDKAAVKNTVISEPEQTTGQDTKSGETKSGVIKEQSPSIIDVLIDTKNKSGNETTDKKAAPLPKVGFEEIPAKIIAKKEHASEIKANSVTEKQIIPEVLNEENKEQLKSSKTVIDILSKRVNTFRGISFGRIEENTQNEKIKELLPNVRLKGSGSELTEKVISQKVSFEKVEFNEIKNKLQFADKANTVNQLFGLKSRYSLTLSDAKEQTHPVQKANISVENPEYKTAIKTNLKNISQYSNIDKLFENKSDNSYKELISNSKTILDLKSKIETLNTTPEVSTKSKELGKQVVFTGNNTVDKKNESEFAAKVAEQDKQAKPAETIKVQTSELKNALQNVNGTKIVKDIVNLIDKNPKQEIEIRYTENPEPKVSTLTEQETYTSKTINQNFESIRFRIKDNMNAEKLNNFVIDDKHQVREAKSELNNVPNQPKIDVDVREFFNLLEKTADKTLLTQLHNIAGKNTDGKFEIKFVDKEIQAKPEVTVAPEPLVKTVTERTSGEKVIGYFESNNFSDSSSDKKDFSGEFNREGDKQQKSSQNNSPQYEHANKSEIPQVKSEVPKPELHQQATKTANSEAKPETPMPAATTTKETSLQSSKENNLFISESDENFENVKDFYTLGDNKISTDSIKTASIFAADDPVKHVRAKNLMYEISKFFEQKYNNSITFKITPEHLGKVKIQLKLINDVLKASIEVENDQVKHAVESSLNSLKSSLMMNGLTSGDISVFVTNQQPKGSKYFPTQKRKERSYSEETETMENTTGLSEQNLINRKYGYNTYEFTA